LHHPILGCGTLLFRIRLSVGEDATDASSMRLSKETELNNGDATVPENNRQNWRSRS